MNLSCICCISPSYTAASTRASNDVDCLCLLLVGFLFGFIVSLLSVAFFCVFLRVCVIRVSGRYDLLLVVCC